MARVIGHDYGAPKQVKCKCFAVVEYDNSDVVKGVYCDYGGGREDWYYVKCPSCRYKIEVNNK